MKMRGIVIFALLVLLSLSAGTNAAAQSKTYKVGDKGPAGGIIFYDKGYVIDNWRYLEAAPEDLDKTVEWESWGTITSGTFVAETTVGLGYGKQNTKKIIDKLKQKNCAAQLCANLNIGGYKDWYLPNLTELRIMYKNLKQKNLGGLKDDWYWSSWQNDGPLGDNMGHAWAFNFKTGKEDYSTKGRNYYARAIRQFQ